MRAALGSDRAANALKGRGGMTYGYGSTAERWVIAMVGRLRCPPPCAISVTPPGGHPVATTGTNPRVMVEMMVVTVDPATLQFDPSLRLGHGIDMAQLGHVWPLGAYMEAMTPRAVPEKHCAQTVYDERPAYATGGCGPSERASCRARPPGHVPLGPG